MPLDENRWYRGKITEKQFRDDKYPYVDYIIIINRTRIKIQFPRTLKENSRLWRFYRDSGIPVKKDNFEDLIGKEILIKPMRKLLNDTVAIYVITGDSILTNIKPIGTYFVKEEDRYANEL